MPSVEIQSLSNKNAVLSIYSIPGHDMTVNTESYDHPNEKYEIGSHARIYCWAGSQNFGNLHDQFCKTVTTKIKLNKDIVQIDAASIDLERFEKTNLIEDVDTKSILTIYRDNAGHIGIQTLHSTYYKDPRFIGPVIWICGDTKSDASPAMRARRRNSIARIRNLYNKKEEQ
jgi:hypothetical protein